MMKLSKMKFLQTILLALAVNAAVLIQTPLLAESDSAAKTTLLDKINLTPELTSLAAIISERPQLVQLLSDPKSDFTIFCPTKYFL